MCACFCFWFFLVPWCMLRSIYQNIFTLFFSAFRIIKGRQISVPFACKDREICRENGKDNRRILLSFRSVPVCLHLTAIETLNLIVLYFPQPVFLFFKLLRLCKGWLLFYVKPCFDSKSGSHVYFLSTNELVLRSVLPDMRNTVLKGKYWARLIFQNSVRLKSNAVV